MSFHSGAVPWRRREQKEGRPFVRTRRSRARSLGATIRRLKPAEDRPIAAWGASGDIAQTNERMNARVVRKSMPESYGAREGGLGDESQAAAATCFRKESLLSIPRGNLSLHTRAGKDRQRAFVRESTNCARVSESIVSAHGAQRAGVRPLSSNPTSQSIHTRMVARAHIIMRRDDGYWKKGRREIRENN